MTIEEQLLFPDYEPLKTGKQTKSKSYDDFVRKFEPKLTTDDCYTPPAVYDAVLGWVRENCDIEGRKIIRPFYPGGDYVNYPYEDNDVVIDNPPFSIITQIVKHYVKRGIRFFLFAPYLTLLRPARHCTGIVIDCNVVYANGTNVNMSFVSNMFGDCALMTAPDLRRRIIVANESSSTKSLPKYVYPANVLTATMMGNLCRHDVTFSIGHASCKIIAKLRSQGNKDIFGGGYLISEKKAAEKKAAEKRAAKNKVAKKIAAEKEAAEMAAAIVWDLSDEEREIISRLE